MTEEFVIQSDIANLPELEEQLFHFCHNNNIGSYYSAVSFAAIQAVKNAIEHGNHNDVSKQVSISLGTCQGGVYVEVEDQGEGFDYSAYGMMPLESEKKGEGIFVMKQLADNLIFSKGGCHVRMEFMVAGIEPAVALGRIAVMQAHFSQVAAC